MADNHNNEWTVATLKAYFEALRIEDHRAIELLAKNVKDRLNILIMIVSVIVAIEGAFRLFHYGN